MPQNFGFTSGWDNPFDNIDKDGQQDASAEESAQAESNIHADGEIKAQESTTPTESNVSVTRPYSDGNELNRYIASANSAFNTVDDIVMKGYLERLSSMDVLAPEEDSESEITLFKINLMAYEKDENATEKFVSAFSAMTFTSNTVFLIVDGHESKTDFYLGVKNNDTRFTAHSIADTFESSIKGQFPGISLSDMSVIEQGKDNSAQHRFLRDIKDATSISSFVGVPSLRNEDVNRSNESYVQGIEKFADAMHGKRYTAIIVARSQTKATVNQLRHAYEQIYSQISCLGSQQISYSVNESTAQSLTRGLSTSTTTSHSVSNGTTNTESKNFSKSKSTTDGTNSSTGESKPNFWGRAGQLASPLIQAGAILSATGVGAPAGAILMGVGAVMGIGGTIGQKTKTKSEGTSHSETVGESESTGTSTSTSRNISDSTSEGKTDTTSKGDTSTKGSSRNYTLTLHNKQVEDMLKLIDKQLERIDNADSNGMWSTCSYFLSYDNDKASSQTGAAIFRSIVQGDKSGLETSALNTWRVGESGSGRKLLNSIADLSFPQFEYTDEVGNDIRVEGASLITSSELAMMMGLPRSSVPGLPVIDYVSLGKEVVKSSGVANDGTIDIGSIFDQGAVYKDNKVKLNAKSLTQHVFVTGSTGCGKSETVYRLIDQAQKAHAKYLVIEPAKGEYKSVFGNANVFGTNPLLMPLLRINPFAFPDGIHILEHIDKLVDIFNVCWPMYAAMPAVLKKAVLKSYENCGWKLYESVNKYGHCIFPSFDDLLSELENAINESAYSDEVKGNYIGSLVTRVESLTNGINGEIFSADEISDEVLFDQNTIVDLSRIGSQETKSLIMGILIMRLNEHRMVNAKGANEGLKHLTVLEEAHNILTRTSTEQSMEGSNVAGKSVEMIVNSIAEMRTYGEGFVIVDQSPTSVNAAAIKNTNTKIIMRLPDGEDRKIAGKSAGLKDDQIDELSKLPTGVAVVYQNDWIQPVMCKISMASFERKGYKNHPDEKPANDNQLPILEILKLLLKGRLMRGDEPNINLIETSLLGAKAPVSMKVQIMAATEEYKASRKIRLWRDDCFPELSEVVTQLLGLERKVNDAADKAVSFDDLNVMLNEMINRVVVVPQKWNLTLRQMLMRNYSTKGASQLKIYNAWFIDIKNKLKDGH